MMNKVINYEIKNWNDIAADYKDGSLIIGNGASIALHQDFDFRSLKEKAEELKLFDEDIAKLFKEFETDDFELILRLVWHAKLVNNHLGVVDTLTDQAYKILRESLIKIVKVVHCSYSQIESELPRLYKFTKSFKDVVSLNYDLILYWIRMYGNESCHGDGHIYKDGFQNGGNIYWDWKALKEPYYLKPEEKEITRTFYQHGNLSIFRYSLNLERKIKRGDDVNLLDNIANYWNDDVIPLFVAEGTGGRKEESIRTSKYLSKIYYEILPELFDNNKNLVIYGWGVGGQENHLVTQVFKNKMGGKVAISVYKDDQDYCYKVEKLIQKISPKVEIEFFDSQSAGCWNNP